MENIYVLAINPGSTSTKIAVFENEKPVFQNNIKHTNDDLKDFTKITDQYEFRKNIILEELKKEDIDINRINGVVGRGGLVQPIESGVYEINEAMMRDLINSPLGEHASNLGGLIAQDIAKSIGSAKAFIADPVVVDELDEVARYAGHPNFERKSIFHALNQKAVARTYAKSISKKYEELNLIVTHLGGGISVGAHCKGRVIDVNQALDGEGPFSPERSGTLPVGDVVKMCFSGKYSQGEIKKMIKGEGGMVAYLGTNNAYEAETRALDGEEKALMINKACAYQIAKEIGAMSTVMMGQVDAIILTGGMAHGEWFVDLIKERIAHIAEVKVFPGEDEMRALASNGLMALRGQVDVKVYDK